ncbi:MAG: carboxypeptidase regulatory-like domain-containing protein, partial [Planctomycetes bacterium]|nr:carboxypeptidase regulatory-like domain-containing protein [Planctomycetota bacterium]
MAVRISRSALVAVLAAVLVSALGLLHLWRSRSSVPDVDAPRAGGRSEQVSPVAELERPASLVARTDTSGTDHDVVRTVRGRVLDSAFRSPLRATVRVRGGAAVTTSGSSGEFRLPIAAAGDIVLEASSPRHTPRIHELTASAIDAEQVIVLEPGRSSSLLVVGDSDLPLEGVAVAWSAAPDLAPNEQSAGWLHEPERPGQFSVEVPTDTHGISRLTIGRVALVRVADPYTGSEHRLRLEPGEDRRIRLSADLRVLRFVDGLSDRPLPALELAAWSPELPRKPVSRLLTDDHGLVRLAVSDLPLLIRAAGTAMWESTLAPQGTGLSLVGLGGPAEPILRVDPSAPSDGIGTVAVFPCGGWLRFVDRSTGA